MKTTIIRLQGVASGDFEKLNSHRLHLTVNNTIGNTGTVSIAAHLPNVSTMQIKGGIFTDSSYNVELGDTIDVDVNGMVRYFKLTSTVAYIDILKVDNIRSLGALGWIFSETSSQVRGIMQTSDLRKFINLQILRFNLSTLQGALTDIPETVTDLRAETSGLTGSLNDLKRIDFSGGIRLRQPNITGDLASLANKELYLLVLDTPLITGDIGNLTDTGLINLGFPNTGDVNGAAWPGLTSTLNENNYFPALSNFTFSNFKANREQLYNLLKSLEKSNWAGSARRCTLATSMTESAYNADSAIQAVVTALKAKVLTYQIYFS